MITQFQEDISLINKFYSYFCKKKYEIFHGRRFFHLLYVLLKSIIFFSFFFNINRNQLLYLLLLRIGDTNEDN